MENEHNEQLHNLYSFIENCHQSKEVEMGGSCGMRGENEKYIQHSGWKPLKKKFHCVT